MNNTFAWDKYFVDSIFENVNVWINAYDQDMNLVMWNPQAEKTSGYSRDEVVGNNKIWEWLYPNQAYREEIVDFAASVVHGIQPDNFETTILCKDGTYKTIVWNSRAIANERGDFLGVVTFGYDVTERKKTEDALRVANGELSTLYSIASATSSLLDLDEILQRALEEVLPALQVEKGVIHLWDAEQQQLRLRVHVGFNEASLSDFYSLSIGSGVISRVFAENRPIPISNFRDILSSQPNLPPQLFNSYLGVPINAKRHNFGVFSVLGKADKQFTQEDINLLSLIADQTGVAVESNYLYQRARQLAVSEERRRLARDLHDAVTQSVYSLTLFAEAGQRAMTVSDYADATSYLEEIGATAQSALREMRVLLHELRPFDLETESLVDAIQSRLDSVERRVGITAHLTSNLASSLPPALGQELYRIVQEALNNTLRHASAEKVTVTLNQQDNQLHVAIHDDGIGYNLATHEPQGGMGLESMRERCEKLGGDFAITTAKGEGFTVAVTITLQNDDHS